MTTPNFMAVSLGVLGIAAIASAQPLLISTITNSVSATKANQQVFLPKALETKIIEDLTTRLGLPQPPMSNIKIVQAILFPPPRPQRGVSPLLRWQVTVQAQGQAWVYMTTGRDNTVVFDTVKSISPTVKAALAKRLGITVKDLRIKAAELVTLMRNCPANSGCLTGYEWKWRILTANSPQLFSVDEQGNEWIRWQEKTSSAGMPLSLKNTVMRDVINRQTLIPPNLNVESLKAVTWNFCQGGGSDRPTPPEMGICPNINYAGWQMRVRSGAVLYTYYVKPSDNQSSIAPDGMQSIPKDAIEKVKQDVAKRAKVSAQNIRIQRVSPQYFDRCLDVAGTDCQSGVQAGWTVMALGGQSPNTAWFYRVSLLGDQLQFMQTGNWFPPPSAPPPRR